MDITAGARQVYDDLAQGWNTWDVRSVSTHVYMPEQVGITLAFFMPSQSRYRRDLAWSNVERFGEHADDGSCTDITLLLWGRRIRVQTCAQGEELLIRAVPQGAWDGDLFMAVEIEALWGADAEITRESGTIKVKAKQRAFSIDSPTPQIVPEWIPCRSPHLIWAADQAAYVRVNSCRSPQDIDAAIEQAEAGWLARTIHSEGVLEEALAAMRRCLLWNTIYESRNRRVVSPVTRNWCRTESPETEAIPWSSFGAYTLFGWDTFFAALMLGMIDKRLAYANFLAMLEEQTADGMVPNYGSGKGISVDRSEPQVGAWCAWKLYLQHGDKWFIEEIFDRLLAWNRWRFRERDGNGDGLLEMASKPESCGKQGAMWESGLDNSPMWDDAAFSEEHQCMELSYVGLNALVVADCECLEKMAALLGREKEQTELAARRESLTRLINTELWSETDGIYLNKDWHGAFSPKLSPTHLYPMLAGIADEHKVARMMDEHLLNPDEFWGEFVIPMTSRSEAAFQDQAYWRGRIWAPTNFLVTEGIRRSGRRDLAERVTRSGFDMFLRRWRQGIVGENYNAITGEAGEEGKVSDPFYHWGALLVYMAIQERIDFQVWNDTVYKMEGPTDWGPLYRVPCKDGYLDLQ